MDRKKLENRIKELQVKKKQKENLINKIQLDINEIDEEMNYHKKILKMTDKDN